MTGSAKLPLDMAIAIGLMAAGWGFAAYLGYSLLSPNADLGLQLAVLMMAALYQAAAFVLASRARTVRWNALP